MTSTAMQGHANGFADAGMRRVEAEMTAAIERDSETCLAVVLAHDFAVGT